MLASSFLSLGRRGIRTGSVSGLSKFMQITCGGRPYSNTAPLRVAALQVNCQKERNKENLNHCERLLSYELRKLPTSAKPQLILLPELFHCYYNLVDKRAWANAEPLNERKSSALIALRRWASEHGCFIGGTILEASKDGDFFNTFVMVDPLGKLLEKKIRKYRPASFEAFIFTGGGEHDHSLQLLPSLLPSTNSIPSTGIGKKFTRPLRVSVAICYENALYPVMKPIQDSAPVDLHLAPFCAPEPVSSIFFPKADTESYREALLSLPSQLSRQLNTFVLSCNKTGSWESKVSKLFGVRMMPKMEAEFLPLTSLYAPKGKPISSLRPNEEGLLTGSIDISIDPPHSSEKKEEMQKYFHWDAIVPFPKVVRNGFPLMEKIGSWSYQKWKAKRRFALAHRLSKGNHDDD